VRTPDVRHNVSWLLHPQNALFLKNRFRDIYPKHDILRKVANLASVKEPQLTWRDFAFSLLKALLPWVIGVYGLYSIIYVTPNREIGDYIVDIVAGVLCLIFIFGSLGGFGESFLYFCILINPNTGYYYLMKIQGDYIEGKIVGLMALSNNQLLIQYQFFPPSPLSSVEPIQGEYILPYRPDISLRQPLIVIYSEKGVHTPL
jgi:hypothetical protein